jgi:hypothetical protein
LLARQRGYLCRGPTIVRLGLWSSSSSHPRSEVALASDPATGTWTVRRPALALDLLPHLEAEAKGFT